MHFLIYILILLVVLAFFVFVAWFAKGLDNIDEDNDVMIIGGVVDPLIVPTLLAAEIADENIMNEEYGGTVEEE